MAQRVCPVWVGYLSVSPFRKLLQNPEKILSPYVETGMKVLDIGCSMGFFSLPLAQMVGSDGKVICVDLQQKMIEYLEKRAKKAGLSKRIETRICSESSFALDGLMEEIDFALAFYMVHEVPDVYSFFSQIHKAIRPGGRFLVVEPKGHVSQKDFEVTVSIAEKASFRIIEHPRIGHGRTVLLGR